MKKIAFIVDADNWAYANIARNMSKRLSKYYDFIIIPSQYFNDELAKVLLLTKDCDLIHFFWRGKLLGFDLYNYEEYVKVLGFTKESFTSQYFANKIITTSVYDHLYLDDENMNNTKVITERCDRYYVSSNLLFLHISK